MIRLIKDAPISDQDKLHVEQLYNTYKKTMLGVAYKILKDTSLAEDAVSECFIKIIRHRKKLTDVLCHQTRAYIVTIVRTTSYDLQQQKNRHSHDSDDALAELPDNNENVLAKLTAEEGYVSIKTELQKLPRKLREVAHRFLTLEMTHEEIANELGITVDTSKKRLSRARAIIKENLGGDVHD